MTNLLTCEPKVAIRNSLQSQWTVLRHNSPSSLRSMKSRSANLRADKKQWILSMRACLRSRLAIRCEASSNLWMNACSRSAMTLPHKRRASWVSYETKSTTLTCRRIRWSYSWTLTQRSCSQLTKHWASKWTSCTILMTNWPLKYRSQTAISAI